MWLRVLKVDPNLVGQTLPLGGDCRIFCLKFQAACLCEAPSLPDAEVKRPSGQKATAPKDTPKWLLV